MEGLSPGPLWSRLDEQMEFLCAALSSVQASAVLLQFWCPIVFDHKSSIFVRTYSIRITMCSPKKVPKGRKSLLQMSGQGQRGLVSVLYLKRALCF